MDGFFRRVWKEYGVDKVTTLKSGMFMIRLKCMEFRDKILNMDRLFFYRKPVMLKARHMDMDLTKDDIYDIPIWVNLDLNFKYWGEKCLEKIIRPVGKLIKRDAHTVQRVKLSYAHCRIDVSINQHFPASVNFINEKKEVTTVPIVYEWRLEEEAESGANKIAGPSNETIIEDKSGNKGDGGNSLNPIDSMICWNVRGANHLDKMRAIRQSAPGYKERVHKAWHTNVEGTAMFKVVQKLKSVKSMLKDLNRYGYSNIKAEAAKAHHHLMQTQALLHANPMDAELMEQETVDQKMYKERNEAYMQFLKQKAKIQWIKEGDENTALFHYSIKRRRVQNNIYVIKDKHGNIQDSPNGIQKLS
ncbi:Beta-galactosidase BgaA [Bienertia sinuspersici]